MFEVKVKLYTGDCRRLTISKGCKISQSTKNYQFEENSFSPIMEWQSIDRNMFKKLTSNKINYSDVSLIGLPKKLKNKLNLLNLSKCFHSKDLRIIENTLSFIRIKNELIKYFSNYSIKGEEIIPHNIYFGSANLINNTFNHSTNRFIGFHLDSWEGDPLHKRKYSNNRICLNLGENSRYIMFYNISILGMAKALNISLDDENIDINNIYKKYIVKYPNTSIYRLEVLPFEAYIAPTEFIIHDGSSMGTTSPDINIVFRGKFLYKKQNVINKLIRY